MDRRKVMGLYVLILIFGISKSLGLPKDDGVIDLSNDLNSANVCSGVNIMQDLDADQFYDGKFWYEVGIKSSTEAKKAFDCAKIRFTKILGTNDDVTFEFQYQDRNDYLSVFGHIQNETGTPYSTVKFDVDSTESMFYVLSTDYDSYALAYSCSSNLEDRKQDRIWVLSRTNQPETNYTLIQEAIKEQSDEFQKKLSDMQGCKELHDDVVYCPKPKNKPSLDLKQFAEEEWFEQVKSLKNYWEDDDVCGNITFNYDEKGETIKITFEGSDPGLPVVIPFNVVKTDENEIVFINSDEDVFFSITDTDYDNYAVFYSCSQKSRREILESIWLLGQYEEISKDVIDKVNDEFGDILKNNISCPVPQAPTTTTTTIKSTNVPTTVAPTDEVPTTTDRGSNSTQDRPPAYTYPGYDNKFYYLFQLENNNKTANEHKG